VEVEIHLVDGEIHLDYVILLQMQFSVRVGDLDVAGFDGEIELFGAGEYGGTEGIIRRAGVAGERSNVLAQLVVFEIDRGQSQKDACHSGQNENRRDQTPER